jgi:hypothetical protein
LSFNDVAFADRCHFLDSAKKAGPAEVLPGGFHGALGNVG